MAAVQVYATQIYLSFFQKSNCKDIDYRKSSFIGPHPLNQNTWYLRRWKKYGKPHPWKRSGGGREGWGGYRAIRGYNISMLAGACPARLVSRCHLCQVMLL